MSDFTPEQVERAAEALRGAREHFAAIAGSGPIQVWEGTGESRGIDHQATIWARRGERFCAEAIAVLSAAGAPEELAHLRAGIKHVSGRMAEARATLQGYADRIDEHVFGELASELDDQWCDFETGMPLGAPEKPAPVVDEAALAEVIAPHKMIWAAVSRDAAYCRCGEKYPRNGQPHMEWFELHRAAAVAAYLRGESK